MLKNIESTESHRALLYDCSNMDDTVVERLRATVKISLEWADQALDALIQLDSDLQAYSTKVNHQRDSHLSAVEAGNPILGINEIAHQTELSVQHLRNGMRDLMMSMQNQDVIGQAVERAASALEKRTVAIGRVVEGLDSSHLHKSEIAELHRAYRTEDDLHRDTSLEANEV